MMHPYLQMSDDELYEHFVGIVKKNNPTLVIGERMRGPLDVAWNGKLYNVEPVPDDVIHLDFTPEHIEPDKVEIKAQSLKVMFNQIHTIRFPFEGYYIYPYQVIMPHRKWLTKYESGDKVAVVDDAFSAVTITLTQDIIDDHCYIYFRHAVSAK